MKNTKKFCPLISLLLITNVFSADLRCPNVGEIKQAQFIKATYRDSSWDVYSEEFIHNGRKWNIAFFGLGFQPSWVERENYRTEKEAIQSAQNTLSRSEIKGHAFYYLGDDKYMCFYGTNYLFPVLRAFSLPIYS